MLPVRIIHCGVLGCGGLNEKHLDTWSTIVGVVHGGYGTFVMCDLPGGRASPGEGFEELYPHSQSCLLPLPLV